ncbi:solute carrier family 47 [Pelomyxa schiedti]|nr:solute carrier family 47 [Pelomyxa schiedti]
MSGGGKVSSFRDVHGHRNETAATTTATATTTTTTTTPTVRVQPPSEPTTPHRQRPRLPNDVPVANVVVDTRGGSFPVVGAWTSSSAASSSSSPRRTGAPATVVHVRPTTSLASQHPGVNSSLPKVRPATSPDCQNAPPATFAPISSSSFDPGEIPPPSPKTGGGGSGSSRSHRTHGSNKAIHTLTVDTTIASVATVTTTTPESTKTEVLSTTSTTTRTTTPLRAKHTSASVILKTTVTSSTDLSVAATPDSTVPQQAVEPQNITEEAEADCTNQTLNTENPLSLNVSGIIEEPLQKELSGIELNEVSTMAAMASSAANALAATVNPRDAKTPHFEEEPDVLSATDVLEAAQVVMAPPKVIPPAQLAAEAASAASKLAAEKAASHTGWLRRADNVTRFLFCCPTNQLLKEVFIALKMGWPVCLCYLFQTILTSINLTFVGHIGEDELAATSLALMVVNVSGFSFGVGLLGAIDTLSSQAFGAGNCRRVGIILQRAVLMLWVYCIPVIGLWCSAEYILILAKQDPDIVKMASKYVKILIPALPFYFLFEALKRTLQTQGITFPMMVIALVSLGILALFNYIFINVLNLGFIGSAISLDITWISMPIMLIIWILVRKLHLKMWKGFSKEALKNWPTFLSYGIPGGLMSCAEWWGFEIVSVLTGIIGKTQLASNMVGMNTLSILLMVPLGMSTVGSTQIGNCLGANDGSRARVVTRVAMAITVIAEVIQILALLGLRTVWGKIFSDDPDVIKLVSQLLLLSCSFIMFDGLQTYGSGILRGCGKQKIGALGNLASFYVVGIPIGAVLAFVVGIGIFGLWIGIGISVFLTALSFSLIIYKTKWDKLAQEVHEREASNPDEYDPGLSRALSDAFIQSTGV